MNQDYREVKYDRVRVSSKDRWVTVTFTSWSYSDLVTRMLNDITSNWSTSRIGKAIIKKVKGKEFRFSKFFIPEVIYMVDYLITKGRRLSLDKATYRDMKEGLTSNTWYSEVERNLSNPPKMLDRSMLDMFIFKPTDFNLRFFNEYEVATGVWGKKGHILAGAPGTGKTYMALALAEMRRVDNIIVVCLNNNVEDPWVKSLSALDVYKLPQTYWKVNSGLPYNGERALICHYEALDKLTPAVSKLKGRVMVILDESHHMNEIKSGRTQKFIGLCRSLQSRLECEVVWASGTPLKKQGSEVIPFLLTTDPFIDLRAAEDYKKAFGAEGLRGADVINHRISLVMSVIEKTELDSPKPVVEYVPVTLTNAGDYTLTNVRKQMLEFIKDRQKYYEEHHDQYTGWYKDGIKHFEDTGYGKSTRELFDQYTSNVKLLRSVNGMYSQYADVLASTNAYEKDYIVPTLPRELSRNFIDAKSFYKYLPLKIQGECLGRVVGGARIQCVRDIAEQANIEDYIKSSDTKTVIFSSYVSVVTTVTERLKEGGYYPLEFHGENTRELPTILRSFKEEPNANPIVTTFQSLSTGVPLVEASTMVMMNPPFRPYVLEQSISRIDRMGQKYPTRVFILVLDTGLEDNISTRTKDILGWAQEMVEALMGIKSAYGLDDTQEGIESFVEVESRSASLSIGDGVKVAKTTNGYSSLLL